MRAVPRSAPPDREGNMRSTALVLWLMILLVFVPIVAAHGVALYLQSDEPPATASIHAGAPGQKVLAR